MKYRLKIKLSVALLTLVLLFPAGILLLSPDAAAVSGDDAWSARFDATGLAPDTVSAMRDLSSLYGGEVVEWIANLWDPSVGGFYYANSARDYDAFLPDIESTNQILGFLRSSGMLENYGNSPSRALPLRMQKKMLAFAQSLEDPDDGYFYHPQWGKDISSSRRGRDLNWAISVISMFGGEPLYPTVLDRLSGGSSLQTASVEKLLAARELPPAGRTAPLPAPDYLSNETAFHVYLESLNVNHDSHATGHILSCQASQIKAAGLADVCCDYLDSIQCPETGLWQDEVNYTSLSGLLKISTMYSTAGRSIPYADRAVESALEAIMLETDPSIVIYVYNPWAGLANTVNNMKSTNSRAPGTYDMEAIFARIRENAPAMIEKTKEKIALFRKSDGSFSYNQKNSAPYTQGTFVSLGMNEGDVNATVIATTGIWGYICTALGVSRVPLYRNSDFTNFMNIVNRIGAVEKRETFGADTEGFEETDNGILPYTVTATLSTTGSAAVIDDPRKSGEHILSFASAAGAGDTVTFRTPTAETGMTDFLFEGDFCIQASNDGTAYQIKLGKSNTVYMLLFKVSGGNAVLWDCPTTATEADARNLGISIPLGEWFRLRVLYNPEDLSLEISVNGTVRTVGTNHYSGATADMLVQDVNLYAMRTKECTLLLDNLRAAVFSDSVPNIGNATANAAVAYDTLTGVGEISDGANDARALKTDPVNPLDSVLSLTSTRTEAVPGASVKTEIASSAQDVGRKAVSFRLYVPGRGENQFLGDYFTETGNRNLYQLSVQTGGKTVSLLNLATWCGNAENPAGAQDGSAAVTGYHFVFTASPSNDVTESFDSFILSLDRWYTVTLLYDFSGVPSCELFVSGVSLGKTDIFFLENGATPYLPTASVSLSVASQQRTKGEILIDDATYLEFARKGELGWSMTVDGVTTSGVRSFMLPALPDGRDVWIARDMFGAIGIYRAGETVIPEADTEIRSFALGVRLLDGASVRLTDTHTGIRFSSAVNREGALALSEWIPIKEISFGTAIVPTSFLSAAGATTLPALRAYSPVIVDLVANGFASRSEDGEEYIWHASLVEMKTANYNRPFSAITYIRINDTFVYADYAEEKNSRTVSGVAASALADEETDYGDNATYALSLYANRVLRVATDASVNLADVTAVTDGSSLSLSSSRDLRTVASVLVWEGRLFRIDRDFTFSPDGKNAELSLRAGMNIGCVSGDQVSGTIKGGDNRTDYSYGLDTYDGRSVFRLTKLGGRVSGANAYNVTASFTSSAATLAEGETVGNMVFETRFLFDDFTFSESGNSCLCQLALTDGSKTLYMLTVSLADGKLVISDVSNTGANTAEKTIQKKTELRDAAFDMNRWINLRVTLRYDATDFEATVFAGYDGEDFRLLGTSRNFYNHANLDYNTASPTPYVGSSGPYLGVKGASFTLQQRAVGILYIDEARILRTVLSD